jgi:putative ABC transport system permease protein
MNFNLLARRNLLRNRRRSLVTILSIAFGVAAVAIFAGYTKAMYLGLRNMAVHGELLGQLSINKTGWYTEGKLHPNRFVLSEADLSRIADIIHHEFPQAHVIPRMGLEGLLSNARSSTIFLAYGIAPDDLQTLLGPLGGVYRGLSADQPNGVAMADGLGAMLGLAIGSDAAVLVSTINGQANAADIEVRDRMNTGNTATNDKFMLMPIALTRSLKDIGEGAEWVTVLLDSPKPSKNIDEGIRALFTTRLLDDAQVEAARSRLKGALDEVGLGVDVHTWRGLSVYYNQVKRLYDIIFTLLLSIVVGIVVLSIANAMSMSVVERTREIGTLRAIGLRRTGVVRLFVTEALLLVAIGSIVGVIGSVLASWLVTVADIRYIPPGNSMSVPVYIAFDPVRIALTLVVLGILSIVAAFFPTRKAAYQPIIDSLSHA